VTTTTSGILDALSIWLASQLDELSIPGAALGIISPEGSWTYTHGTTDLQAPEPITPSTGFRIASLSKIVTASSLALLASKGAIDLFSPLRTYLPGFRIADVDTSEAVSTAHLLSHSAGWIDAVEPDATHDDLTYYLDQMQVLEQMTPPGQRFSYSNCSYLLAGHLIESITGQDFESAVHESILEPLGMRTATFASGPEQLEEPPVPRAANPAWGLRASVDDMLRFLEAQLKDTGPLAPMLQPRVDGGSIGPATVSHIGLGWMLQEIGNRTVAISMGSDSGSSAAMAMSQEVDFGIVVLTYTDAGLMLASEVVFEGISRFLGATKPEPRPVALRQAEIEPKLGTYSLWDGMSFDIGEQPGKLMVTTSAGGEELPQLSGPLTMSNDWQGYVPALGGKLWFDFVRGDTGTVDWLRFAGRLAPRAPA
jgi:CubicO group peptidase (beta-lactamase class C family)